MTSARPPAAPAPPRRGRPRDERAEQAILAATVELLNDVGFAGLSIEAVAARAGVGRPTVYRRWPSKMELVIDAVLRLAPPLTVDHSGDPLTDLKELVARLIVDMTSAPIGRAILALTGDAGTHTDLAQRLTKDYLTPRRDALLAILRDAVAAGELPRDLDLDLTLDLMLGAPTYRWLTTGRPVDQKAARAIVDAVWRTATAPPA